jgi:hypothetical protein
LVQEGAGSLGDSKRVTKYKPRAKIPILINVIEGGIVALKRKVCWSAIDRTFGARFPPRESFENRLVVHAMKSSKPRPSFHLIAQTPTDIGRTLSSEGILRLRCHLENVYGAFTIKAPLELEVGELKELIQQRWQNSVLKNVDYDSLELWKVGVVRENGAR